LNFSKEEYGKGEDKMEFKEELKNYQTIINQELEKYVRKEDCYEKKVNDAMAYSLMAGGKRLRAILVMDTYRLFKEDYEKSFPFAIALEMIHNASLIHDDLPEVDNDDFRHGKPTNHKEFGHATALLAGDELLNYSYIAMSTELLKTVKAEESREELENKIMAFDEFSHAVDRMIIGEYLDTELEGQMISLDLLKYIHKNKTGALLKLGVKMGAILAGAPKEDIERLSSYAEKIGLAFQIKDDILSEEGDEKEMGKPVGNDKERNKCTYVSFYGLEKAKKELDTLIEEALKDLEPYGEKANFLRGLTLYIQTRSK